MFHIIMCLPLTPGMSNALLVAVVCGLVAAALTSFFSLLLLAGTAFLIGGISLVMIESPR